MLDLSFSEAFRNIRIADAYERLVLETMRGNQLLDPPDEVEQAYSDRHYPGSVCVAKRAPKPYAAGTWGPVASIALLARDDREWDE